MEDINTDIRKTTAALLRKRALELCSLEDDSELRAIFLTCWWNRNWNQIVYIIKWPSRCLDTVI